MTLTNTQRADMQGDLGITTDQTVFTNDELDRLFDRAESDYNTAVYLGWRQLMADAAKFFNYTAGQTRVERAKTFDHVKAMVDFWKEESRTAANQVRILGLLEVPPRTKDRPDTSKRKNLPWKDWNGWR